MVCTPCSNCIVKSMCIVGCDELASFIKGRDIHDRTDLFNYNGVATAVRKGEATLRIIGDKCEWRYHGPKRKKPL